MPATTPPNEASHSHHAAGAVSAILGATAIAQIIAKAIAAAGGTTGATDVDPVRALASQNPPGIPSATSHTAPIHNRRRCAARSNGETSIQPSDGDRRTPSD